MEFTFKCWQELQGGKNDRTKKGDKNKKVGEAWLVVQKKNSCNKNNIVLLFSANNTKTCGKII